MGSNRNLEPVPAQWEGPLKRFELSLRMKDRSPNTVHLYMAHLRQLARLVEVSPEMVRLENLQEYILARGWKPSTWNSAVTVFKEFFTLIRPDDDPSAGLDKVKVPQGRPRPVPDEEIMRVLEGADERLALAITLCARLGLRVGECCKIHRDDIEPQSGGHVLRVIGKGSKTRILPLPEDVYEALQSRFEKVGDWAFPSQRGDHLGAHSLSQLMAAALPDGYSAHKLRHRFATKAYEAERDILVVSRLLGHSSVATTQVYAQPPEDALTAAMNAASLPSQQRRR